MISVTESGVSNRSISAMATADLSTTGPPSILSFAEMAQRCGQAARLGISRRLRSVQSRVAVSGEASLFRYGCLSNASATSLISSYSFASLFLHAHILLAIPLRACSTSLCPRFPRSIYASTPTRIGGATPSPDSVGLWVTTDDEPFELGLSHRRGSTFRGLAIGVAPAPASES